MFFLVRLTEKLLCFFGLLGNELAVVGGGALVLLLIQRLMGKGMADRPLLLLGVRHVVLGIEVIALLSWVE